MKITIENRKNMVHCNSCLAYKGHERKSIDYVYCLRVGNNTMSFCESCMESLYHLFWTAFPFKQDVECVIEEA